jgi:hypothetical protein
MVKKTGRMGVENSIPITPESRSNRWLRLIREDYFGEVCNSRFTSISSE